MTYKIGSWASLALTPLNVIFFDPTISATLTNRTMTVPSGRLLGPRLLHHYFSRKFLSHLGELLLLTVPSGLKMPFTNWFGKPNICIPHGV